MLCDLSVLRVMYLGDTIKVRPNLPTKANLSTRAKRSDPKVALLRRFHCISISTVKRAGLQEDQIWCIDQ